MTMPTPYSDDALSAYLDGELSPDECVAVERQLEQSPALRERLDEWSELGTALRSLPPSPAPEGFQEAVISEILTRSVVLPARQPATPERASVARRALKHRTGWSALAAVCLLLGVGGWALRPREIPRHVTSSFDLAKTVVPSERLTDSIDSEYLSLGMAEPTDEILSELPPVPLVIITEEQIRRHLTELNRPLFPGKTLTFKESAGETPILVELTVVDVLETVGQLQVLLRKQSVEGGENVRIEATRSIQGERGESQLVAVYLEMDGPNMAALLNQVQALDAVVYMDESSEEKEVLEQQAAARSMASRAGVEPPASAVAEFKSAPRGSNATRYGDAPVMEADAQTNFNFNKLVIQRDRVGAPMEPVQVRAALPPPEVAAAPRSPGPTDPAAVPARPGDKAEVAGLNRSAAPQTEPGAMADSTASTDGGSPDWNKAKRLRALLLLRQSEPPGTPRSPK